MQNELREGMSAKVAVRMAEEGGDDMQAFGCAICMLAYSRVSDVCRGQETRRRECEDSRRIDLLGPRPITS